MDGGAWWAVVHGVAKELGMTYQLNNHDGDNLAKRGGLWKTGVVGLTL